MRQTIKLNDDNVSVQVAQLLTGFTPDETLFTDQFAEHVKRWQKEHDLSADGIIGDGTWRAIAANAPIVSTKKNKKSAYAKAAQLLLSIDADGIFGTKSKGATIEFQKANNLDADGIIGENTWTMLICGEARQSATHIQPPNFKQYDARWAKKMYSNHGDTSQTMKSSACGPTSMADIVAQWWDVNITPYDLAKLSMEWGTRSYNSGTTSTFFKKCGAKYNASVYHITYKISEVKSCLDKGGYVIVCFGPGTKGKVGYQKWTKGGHYCCIWGYDGATFYINDPASSSSSRAKGTQEEVTNAAKWYYVFER